MASEYEKDVQQFLERMLVIMHLGSGQPARKPELIGQSISTNYQY
jgi:hypothetical protein